MSPSHTEKSGEPNAVEPIRRADGIPDCSQRRLWWKYGLLAAVFLGWVAFLVYCQRAGNLPAPPAPAGSPVEAVESTE